MLDKMFEKRLMEMVKEMPGPKREMKFSKQKEKGRKQWYQSGSIGRKAAIIGGLIITLGIATPIFAANFNINELFKGYFKEFKGTSGGEGNEALLSEPAADDNIFLTEASQIIEQTTENNGLRMSLRGMVGDANSLFLALDVETVDGGAFSSETDNMLNAYTFDKVFLKIDDADIGQYCNMTRIDDGSETGKATFMINETISNEAVPDITGHHITLTINDMKKRSNKIISFDMEKDIAELLEQFPALTEENEGLQKNYILKKTSADVKFSKAYPNLAVNNMGMVQGSLFVNLTLNGDITSEELSNQGLMVINRNTGEELSIYGMSAKSMADSVGGLEGDQAQSDFDSNNDVISVRYQFQGIGSKQQLKDAVFAMGGKGFYEIIKPGEWNFDFTVNYTDTSHVYQTEEATITISPIALAILWKDDSMAEDTVINQVNLELQDGTRVPVTGFSYGPDKEAYTCKGMLPVLIDVEKVKAIWVNDKKLILD